MVGVVWREDEVIWLVFRRRVWRDGRVRRGAREVRVVMWFPDKSIEWMVSGRLLVVDRDSQASSSLLAKMKVCSDGNDAATVATSSGVSSVSARPRYRMLGN